MDTPAVPEHDLLTPSEVGALFRVDPKTVTRWAAAGKLESVRTPGNRSRYPRPAVMALLVGAPEPGVPD